jgi:hypothetical protein
MALGPLGEEEKIDSFELRCLLDERIGAANAG